MNILLISAPGAGKGVISKYLNNKYKFRIISMGNLLRDKAKTDKTINETLKKGNFIGDEIVYNLLEENLNNKDTNIVFEGFPRTINQAKKFDEILENYDIILDKVIYIDIDEEVAKKRITGRLICPNCNNVYNKYLDNIKDNKCINCNSELIKRTDDKLSTYINRYNIFMKETHPLADYYKEKNILYTVDNSKDINDTYEQIDELLERDK